MASVTGVAVAGCLLLVVAGGMKLARPASLARAFDGVGVPGGARLVRAVAAVEVAVGAAALGWGGRTAWVLMAASYAVAAAFVVLVRRRGGVLASCGCFGGAQTPATGMHVVLTAAYAVVMAAATVSPPALTDATTGDVAAVAVTALVIAYLSYAVLAVLPQALSASTIRR